MGQGNVCTYNECEGLYYLDKDFISIYSKIIRCSCGHVIGRDYELQMTAKQLSQAGIKYDFDGSDADWALDCHETQLSWDEMIFRFIEGFQQRFKSFYKMEKWRGNRHIVLQSELFELAVVDGEWCAAWCLLEREDVDDVGRNRTLMRRHYHAYLKAIKTILIDWWGEAIGYGGAWTSGKRYTHEDSA